MPQLNSVKIKGLGPFRNEIFVDLDALPGKVIAITGENGAGKSSFLEIGYPGAIFRQCPTRGNGTLFGLAGEDRNAYVESVITVNGNRYTLRQLVDGVSKKGEALVTNGDGTALTVSGKLKEFDAWSAKIFPTDDVFYSSIFMPQGYGGFLLMPPSMRKSIILNVLGIDHYEGLADIAKQKANEYKIRIENERTNLKKLEGKPTLADAEYEFTMQSQAVEESGLAVIRCRQAVNTVTDEIARVREHNAGVRAQNERRSELLRQQQTLTQTLADLDTKITNNTALVDNADEINNAAARVAVIDQEMTTLSTELETINGAIAVCKANMTAAISESQNAESRAIQARQRVDRYQETLKDSDKVTEAITAIPDTEIALRNAIDTEDLARTALTNLRNQALNSRDDRITELRAGHDEIIALDTELSAAQDISREANSNDNQAVILEAEYPTKIKAAEAYIAECVAEVAAWRKKLSDQEKLAGQASTIEHAARELETAQHDAEHDESIVREKNAAARDFKVELDGHQTRKTELTSQIETLRAERLTLKLNADLVSRLQVAETRLEELRGQRGQVAADLEAMPALPASASELPLPDVEKIKAELTAAETADRQATELLTELRLRCDEARTADADRARITASLVKLESGYADRLRLFEDFGRDGLQALEIDAAGPDLSKTINDLLRSCFGARWTVSVETARMSARGDKQIEGCDILVEDNERAGANKPLGGELLSGGEKVIIGEAISLALSMLKLKRAGIEGATLVRDESGAALSPRYAPKYLAMLRSAVDWLDQDAHIKSTKILFVSHNPEVQQLADATIRINDDASISILKMAA